MENLTTPSVGIMTVAQYANLRRSRGLPGSVVAVNKHIRSGKLTSTKNSAGVTVVDPVVADREWDTNVDKTRKRGNGLKNDFDADRGDGIDLDLAFADSANTDVDDEDMTFAQASTIQKKYQAKLAKIEYEETIGKLIPVAEIQTEWSKIILSLKTKILSVPTSVRQQDPSLTLDQILLIEKNIRDALTEFADGK
jgi:phage terminase Nu1 subunit (DNA packaging protein)